MSTFPEDRSIFLLIKFYTTNLYKTLAISKILILLKLSKTEMVIRVNKANFKLLYFKTTKF